MSVRTGPSASDFGRLFDRADPGSIVAGGPVDRGPAGPLLPQRPVRERSGPVPGRAGGSRGTGGRRGPVRRFYLLALGRPPSGPEIELGRNLLTPDPDVDPWERYCQIILSSNEFIYIDNCMAL